MKECEAEAAELAQALTNLQNAITELNAAQAAYDADPSIPNALALQAAQLNYQSRQAAYAVAWTAYTNCVGTPQ